MDVAARREIFCYQPGSTSLIASLRRQPLIAVLRPSAEMLQLQPSCYPEAIPSGTPSGWATLLDELNKTGVRHLGLAWAPHSGWVSFIKTLKSHWPSFLFGATSVRCADAVRDTAQAGLTYATAPFLDESLQELACQLGLLLVPGVFSPAEIHRAVQLGCDLVKLFPAAALGPCYWGYLNAPLNPLPAVIAAGGLRVSDLDNWLSTGHNAVALGQSLLINGKLDPALHKWLLQYI